MSEETADGGEDGRSKTRSRSGSQSHSRFRPDSVGRVLGAVFALSVGSFVLSFVGTALYMASLPGTPTLTMADPPVMLLVGSWVAIVGSLFGYSSWSAWQLRKMGRPSTQSADRNAVETLNHAATVFAADDQDLGAYDRRLRWTLWAIVTTVFALLIPVAAVFGSPPGG